MPKTGIERYQIEADEDWRSICTQIPFLEFPWGWQIAIIPPFAGAVARFLVCEKKNPKSRVSIYLDWFDNLGYVGEPYWEVHPVDGDCERCLLYEIDKLIKIIGKALKQQRER